MIRTVQVYPCLFMGSTFIGVLLLVFAGTLVSALTEAPMDEEVTDGYGWGTASTEKPCYVDFDMEMQIKIRNASEKCEKEPN